ncbi:glycosyltransferase [Belliella sp. DSM 111904]|uniref:Glycosyltransferase n=1 Tax=Belliella filtrata TaxID=2923435 RepID=A0ABS9UZV5_9BACT|nr:glycosyltransferase [Belliella filtrata]MCH7409685.1 glycosyltransferase [Belliella filtrata]
MLKVSIVIPVFNDSYYLLKTLNSIYNQKNVSNISIETIVVDNGSNINIEKLIDESFDQVIYLKEIKNLNSPYSCRNRGIEVSTGEVIILLDATCVPDPNWLNNGLLFLNNSESDIIGGNVLFDFEEKLTSAKIFDSLTNIKMEESISKGIAKTANLFIKRNVFEIIGLFPEGVRSGADVRWTFKSTSAGLKLKFCQDAVVRKPARDFLELIRKQWRVGTHQPLIRKEQGMRTSILSSIKTVIIPVNPFYIRRLVTSNKSKVFNSYFFRLLVVAQVVKWTMGFANIVGILRMKG